MTDQRRQMRVVDLDKKVQESFAAGKGKGIVTKGPKGFLEGALLNKEVAEAHDKFMADVEVRVLCLRACFFRCSVVVFADIDFERVVLTAADLVLFFTLYHCFLVDRTEGRRWPTLFLEPARFLVAMCSPLWLNLAIRWLSCLVGLLG